MARIENLKVDSTELVIKKDELKDLNLLTEQYKNSVKNLQDRNTNQEFRIVNLNEQAEAAIKELRKVKAKAVLFKVAGISITGALVFALIFLK